MTYEQLERALNQLQEWNDELREINGHNYDPHGYDDARRREIDELKKQEIAP